MRARFVAIALAALIIIPAGIYLGFRQHSQSTVRVVVPNRIYRSGQPTRGVLERARKLGVETVINLRGNNSASTWYQREREQVRALGMRLCDLRFQGLDAPPRTEVLALVAEFDKSERPILIHCADGWDRTGWAAAVVLVLRGEKLDRALRELSPLRGHICKPEKCHFHRFFAEYGDWLTRTRSEHSGATFRSWVGDYAPGKYKAAMHVDGPSVIQAAPGQPLEVGVEVRNDSPMTWRVTGKNPVSAGARLLAMNGTRGEALALFRTPNGPAADLARASFTHDVRPGDTVKVALKFSAPASPGRYAIYVDAVEEFVHWFSDLGREGVIIELRVELPGRS